jgi:hypothetical protein
MITLATRLRDIAAHLPPADQTDLLAVAIQVARMEAVLDETVRDARIAALANVPRIRCSRSADRRI